MKKISIIMILFVVFLPTAYVYSVNQVVDLNGRKIILHDDFTWEYKEKSLSQDMLSLNMDKSFQEVLKSKTETYALYFNPNKWKQFKSTSLDAEFMLQNIASTGYGMIIYEGLEFPIESLKTFVIANANIADPNSKITSSKKCIVNGNHGELITYDVNYGGIDFTMLSFLVSKNSGTIQFTYYTMKSVFEELKPSFLEAISGLVFY